MAPGYLGEEKYDEIFGSIPKDFGIIWENAREGIALGDDKFADALLQEYGVKKDSDAYVQWRNNLVERYYRTEEEALDAFFMDVVYSNSPKK
jgi:hypothetical protein